jgi:proline iminopeptidase
MTGLYAEIEPYHHGRLQVGDGNLIYWERCGNPGGKQAAVLHGGPGSGCSPWFRRLFDPLAYSVVLFDQRNCGRSTPHASEPGTDLKANNTANLIADIELLRQHLDVDRWLVFGGSWGSTLALAYAETYPQRVTEMILFGVTTGQHNEFDWVFRGGLARLFPAQWERLCDALPVAERGGDVVEAFNRLLNDPDPVVRRRAAEAWCLWESATAAWPPTAGLAERFTDPAYAMAFARIVTHFVRHNAWLEDGVLLRGTGALADIPGVLVNGRFDFQATLASAWELSRAWPRAELVVVDDTGHAPNARLNEELIRATNRFAVQPGALP